VSVWTWLALAGAMAVALLAVEEVRRAARASGAGRRFLRHPTAAPGVFILAFFVTVAIAAPLVAPYEPSRQLDIVHLQSQPPSLRFLLGTDLYSRDVWSRLVYGARVSLGIGTLAMLIAVTVGAGVGAAGGAVGGAVVGAAGSGSAIGAASGATMGLLRGLFSSPSPSQAYMRFVDRCLKERGYEPMGWE